jgi:hypothetical protein
MVEFPLKKNPVSKTKKKNQEIKNRKKSAKGF